ncbi:MAG TPA: cyanophycinase [Peptococcaceae bacterium]|nr:cyanophycinase [Peptococcaceae bacterium]
MSQYVSGNLLIIGGAEDKHKDCKILKYFFQEAGGRESRICVITAASENAEEAAEPYKKLFTSFGCSDLEILNIYHREHAHSQKNVDKITRASGIFFTGGDQLRITAMLGGTVLGKALLQAYERQVIIAGTSAGASVMSDTMIIGGAGDTPGEDLIQMAPGLGLIKGVIVDQHFAQRGRIGRLLTAVALNPDVLGIGIDEDTAVHVRTDGKLEVIGRGTALIIDASQADLSNVDELFSGRPLAFAPVKVHVLCAGYEFALRERTSSPVKR